MRKIFPDTNQTNALFNQDDNRATKQDIVDLSNQIEAVDTKVDNVAAELEGLEQDLQDSVNTNAITAETASIDNITSDKVASDEVNANTIKGTIAEIYNIQSNNATISEVTAGNVTTGTVKAQAGTITSIQSDNATIDSADINSADIGTANITNANIQNYNTENIAASGDLYVSGISTLGDVAADNIQADKVVTPDAEIAELSTEEENVENIVWAGTQDLSNQPETFYVIVPHFENGAYYIQLLDNNVPKATIEIFNSVDNYLLRWSQSGYLLYAYKLKQAEASQMAFYVRNLDGHALTLKYATTSATPNVSAPTEQINTPTDINVVYQITYESGNKFFRNVDLANQGVTVGSLTQSPTDVYELDTGRFVYDTTETINSVRYKPDQSLNKNANVKFRTVDATFFDVAELGIDSKITTPHIYDGRQLSAAELDALNDESLVIQAGIETVVDPIGVMLSYRNSGGIGPQTFSGLAPNIYEVIKDLTFENTTRKPADGYELVAYNLIENYLCSNTLQAINTAFSKNYTQCSPTFALCYDIDTNDVYLLARYCEGAEQTENGDTYLFKMTAPVGGQPTSGIYVDNTGHIAINTDAVIPMWVTSLSPDKTATCYGVGMPNIGECYVIYPDEEFPPYHMYIYNYVYDIEGITNITYTHAGGTGGTAKLTRKTTKDNTTQVLPLIPTDTSVSGDDSLPLKYNSTKDAIEKNTSDLTVGNDLTVSNDLAVTNDLTVSGDATITGDITVTGELDATLADGTTVNGDLNVENELNVKTINVSDDVFVDQNVVIQGDLEVRGTTITSDVENVQSEGDYIVLRANNPVPLSNNDFAGIVVHNYNSAGKDAALTVDNSGTFRLSTQTQESVSPLSNVWLVDSQYFEGNVDFSQATLFSENYPVTRYNEVFTDIKAYKSGNNHYFYDPNAETIVYYDNVTYSAQNGVQLAGSQQSFTPGPTDASHDVHFYTSISFMEPQASDMEPILTRDEESSMTDAALIKWDSTDTRAKTIAVPVQNNTYLKANINGTTGEITYSWGQGGGVGVAFIGTRAQYEVAKLIPLGTEGHIPAGAMVIITDENDTIYGDEQ